MDTQTQLAETLYGLLETQEDPQEIMDILPQIDDLNRWNINITDYLRYDLDIDSFVVDVENPEQTHTTGPGGSMVPIPINYGESILEFVIGLIIRNWDLDFEMYPMADEIVKLLVINGAKSSPSLYLKWLSVEEEFEDPDDYPEAFRKMKKIKKYVGLFNTVNRLKNVRKKNRKAKTIQKRLRGNISRLYNAYPTQYMKSKPELRKSVANKIEEGLIEDGIESLDREIFKVEHFDPKWMSDREIEGNRLMADYVDELDQYGGKNKKRTMRKKKKTIQVKKKKKRKKTKKKRRMRGGAGTPDMDEGKLDIIIGQLNQIIDFTRPIEQRPSTYFQPPGGPAMAREQLDKHKKRVEQAFSAPVVPTPSRAPYHHRSSIAHREYMNKFGPLQRAAFSQSLNPRLGVESSTQGIPIELYDKIMSKIPTETNIKKGEDENDAFARVKKK